MKRKPISIAVYAHTFFGITMGARAYAICDDGTIWFRDCNNDKDSSWKRSTDTIPQEES